MYIYWLTCLLSIFISWMWTKTKLYHKSKFLLVSLVSGCPLIILSALRYGIGTDFMSYQEMFYLYFRNGIRAGIEPIFYYLNRGIAILGINIQWLFVICSIIYIILIFTQIYYDSPFPLMSIYLLVSMTFYMSSFNTIRQHIGCAILFFSLRYLHRNNIKKFIFCILIATGFHYTCIIFVFMLLFNYISFKPSKVLVSTIIFLASYQIILKLTSIILAGTKYYIFLEINNTISYEALLGIILQLVILGLASFTYIGEKKYNLYYGLQVVTCWLTILGGSMGMFSRLKWAYALPGIVLIPMALYNIKGKQRRMLLGSAIVICFFVYAQVTVGMLGSFGVVPYKSVFSIK